MAPTKAPIAPAPTTANFIVILPFIHEATRSNAKKKT
jgi:hypothetical protein